MSAALQQRFTLVCTACGASFPFEPLIGGCPACARTPAPQVIETRFDPGPAPAGPASRTGRGVGRFRDLLAACSDPDWITLGEGGTPLLRSRRIGPALGMANLHFKIEGGNPTGSFKDRYVVASINAARRFGHRRIVVSSTGNLGISAAAYAAAANMRALVITLPQTPPAALAQMRLFGAHLVAAAPDDRQRLFEAIGQREDWFPIGLFLRRPVQNPFGIEGYRTLAYEMIEELCEAPDAVLFPCARGNGLYGACKGFEEAVRWGWSRRIPRMVACQPVGANSLEVSIERDAEVAIELPRISSLAFSAAETVASDQALQAIRRSCGAAVSAAEVAIADAARDLGTEGLAVEPSSALPVACLSGLLERGAIHEQDVVVCVLTAHAAAWADHLPVDREAPEMLEPEPAAIDAFLDRNGLT